VDTRREREGRPDLDREGARELIIEASDAKLLQALLERECEIVELQIARVDRRVSGAQGSNYSSLVRRSTQIRALISKLSL
jgi:hypothetical protein